MSWQRALAVIVVSAGFFAAIGAGSRLALQGEDHGQGVLRLSWRMRPERLEQCRDRTQSELDALPVHMRAPRICETTVVPYHLIVEIDDAAADTIIVLPAGAKRDRPMYILHDWPLSPGEHEVEVTFERADSVTRRVLRFDEDLRFDAGRIELITLADDKLKHFGTR